MTKKEINQEEMQILVANRLLPKMMYNVGEQEFTKILSTCDTNGLLYLAKQTAGKSLFHFESAKKNEEGKTILKFSSWPNELIVGSREFLERGIANAYVGGICGCDDQLSLANFENLEALLPYGEVYFNILADDCGRDLIRRKNEFVDKDCSDREFLQAHMQSENPIVKKYARDRNLLKGLADRLHIITTVYDLDRLLQK